MREMTLDEAKKIQIDILRELDLFCRVHDINYSIAYGTLIGAVRHKGFIPWDDDIDVTMLRSDFEKFLKLFHSERYELLKPMRQKRWEFFARVVDPNTVVEFPNHFLESPFGVWLTIFPIDTRPDDETEWLKQKKGIDRAAAIARFKTAVLTKNKIRNGFKRITHFIAKPLSLKRINAEVIKYATMYEGVKTAQKIVWVGYNRYEMYPSELFDSYVELPFEGMQVKAMVGYDTYLRTAYGDYMQLPPVEQQCQTHDYIAYYKD